MVGKIEKEHEARYLKLLKNIEEGQVFEREEEVAWVCQECGHIHFGKKAPKVCPVAHTIKHTSKSVQKTTNILKSRNGSFCSKIKMWITSNEVIHNTIKLNMANQINLNI